jgi:hypothetical protein
MEKFQCVKCNHLGPPCQKREKEDSGVCLAYLVYLVCLVYLVNSVYRVSGEIDTQARNALEQGHS